MCGSWPLALFLHFMKRFLLDGHWSVSALCLGACLAVPSAHADWVIPQGASAQLGGGTVSLGCTDLQLGGTLTLGGGAASAARNVQVATGGQLTVDSGTVHLAQQWTNQGSVTATTGGVTRVASAGCPLVGQAGAVQLTAPTPVIVPLPGGSSGTAQVLVSGPGSCSVTPGSIQISNSAPSLPANATAPLGAVRFTATGCTGSTLTVQVTYPAGTLTGLSVRKYGPFGSPAQAGWFIPANLAVSSGGSGDVVTYTVTDNGDGDSDPTPGVISDPMAPLLLGAGPGPSGGAQSIPSLSQWALLMLSALLGVAGMSGARGRRASRKA